MRLLLLIPNFVLIMISGYNLTNDSVAGNQPSYLTVTMLHLLVMGLCLVFSSLILKSVFKISYTPASDSIEENQPEYEAQMQHS